VRNISTDGYSNDLSNDEQLSHKELQDSDKSIQFIKRAFIDHKKPSFSEISSVQRFYYHDIEIAHSFSQQKAQLLVNGS
jgi:hypothetical protein